MVGRHVWQGACVAGAMHGRGRVWLGAVHDKGHVWQGGMHGRGHVWQEGVHDRGVRGRRDGHCSGRYASYWNPFLLLNLLALIQFWQIGENDLFTENLDLNVDANEKNLQLSGKCFNVMEVYNWYYNWF